MHGRRCLAIGTKRPCSGAVPAKRELWSWPSSAKSLPPICLAGDGQLYSCALYRFQPSARALASASMRAFTRSSSAFTAAFTAGSSAASFTGALAKT